MTILKKLVMAATFLTWLLNVYPQAENKKFTVSQLQQDYSIFTGALKDAHPGLYRYTSKETFERLFATAKSRITHAMTEEEFYKLLMPLIADIKCGHTKLHLEGKPDDRYPFNSDSLFPLKLYFVKEKAYLLYSYDSAVRIAPATEVLTINGKAIPAIMQQLHKYMTIDGDVQSALYEELNHSFNGYYATFMEHAKQYKITYRDNHKVAAAVFPGIKLQTIVKREEENTAVSSLPLRLTYPADSIALLTIESFYANEAVQKFYPFIDSAFKDMKNKKVTNLIIDVRNNEGGEEDWGGYLYSYLTSKKFIYYKKLTLTKAGNYKFAQYAALPQQLDYMHRYVQERKGEIVFTGQKYLSVQEPQANRFKGNIYMLINGLSFSVTTELTSVVHNNRRAVFVGEETGGAYYGNNSGVFEIITLPNTRLTVGIPLVGFYSNVAGYPYKNRGVLPGYTVTTTVDDLLGNKDAVMERTLRLIRYKK